MNVTFGAPIEGTDYMERFCAYGVILNEQNQVALAYCNGEYFLPGGGIEGEESPQDCITRECMEELALEVKIGSHICNVDLFHQSDKTRLFYHSMGRFFFAKLLKQLDHPSEEDHILVWMNADDAVNNLRLESQSWAVSKALKMNKEIV